MGLQETLNKQDMNIWILVIAVMIASFVIQQTLQSRFRKYSQFPTPGGITGAEVARGMLEQNGVTNVRITCIPGELTDHFNPETMTVNLSESVYGQRSIAAAAVAAHECGHVLQHAQGYAPLRLRTKLVPVVTFANKAVQWVLLLGVLLLVFFHFDTQFLGVLAIARYQQEEELEDEVIGNGDDSDDDECFHGRSG